MNRHLFLIFHGRFPSEKAAALFVAKNAESFADNGVTVTLIVPKRKAVSQENPFNFYSIKNNFELVYLPTIDLFWVPGLSFFAFWISFFVFSINSLIYLKKRANIKDIIYSNETLPIWLASFYFHNTFYEMHDFPESKLNLFKLFLKRVKWVLVHNRWKTEMVMTKLDTDKKKLITIPNAVDIKDFDIDVSRGGAREKLKLPLDKKIVIYTGHLYSWKGTDILAQAARNLPETLFIFIGGTEKDVSVYKKNFFDKNILFKGFRPHSEIPFWQKAADVLVLPNTAKENISKYYTSPMKLFEYMASGTPVVASRIPSIEEIVSESDVFFAKPDDVDSFVQTISFALSKKDLADEKSTQARKKVEQYTWDSRAKKIISFMEI